MSFEFDPHNFEEGQLAMVAYRLIDDIYKVKRQEALDILAEVKDPVTGEPEYPDDEYLTYFDKLIYFESAPTFLISSEGVEGIECRPQCMCRPQLGDRLNGTESDSGLITVELHLVKGGRQIILPGDLAPHQIEFTDGAEYNYIFGPEFAPALVQEAQWSPVSSGTNMKMEDLMSSNRHKVTDQDMFSLLNALKVSVPSGE